MTERSCAADSLAARRADAGPRCASFFREPAAVFWTFGFPILLTRRARRRVPEPAAGAGRGGGRGGPAGAARAGARARERRRTLGRASCRRARRAGAPHRQGRAGRGARTPRRSTATIRRGPRAGSPRRRVDDAAPARRRARGPARRRATSPSRAGLALHRLPRPRADRHEPHVDRHVGHRLRHRRDAREEAPQAPRRDADAPADFLLSFVLRGCSSSSSRCRVLLGFGCIVFGVPMRGSLALLARGGAARRARLLRPRACSWRRARRTRRRVERPHEPRDDADVRPVRASSSRRSASPTAVQPFVRALPLTALNDALRAVMNEGAGLVALAPQAALLAGAGAVDASRSRSGCSAGAERRRDLQPEPQRVRGCVHVLEGSPLGIDLALRPPPRRGAHRWRSRAATSRAAAGEHALHGGQALPGPEGVKRRQPPSPHHRHRSGRRRAGPRASGWRPRRGRACRSPR